MKKDDDFKLEKKVGIFLIMVFVVCIICYKNNCKSMESENQYDYDKATDLILQVSKELSKERKEAKDGKER